MFQQLESRTYFLFAGLNLLWTPIVYFFYPETSDRSLESINAMFSTDSPFYSAMEKAYRAEGGEDVLAQRASITNRPENEKHLYSDAGSSVGHAEKI